MDEQHQQPREASVPYPGFGRVVTTKMKEVGVSIDEIADYIEIHPNRVRDYADGKAKTASRDIIGALAKILRIPVSALDVEGDASADEVEYEADKDARYAYVRYPKFLRIVTDRMSELKISQSELARQCRVSHTAIAKYLSGKTLPSDPRVQEALTVALGVTADELFSEQRTRSRFPRRPNETYGSSASERLSPAKIGPASIGGASAYPSVRPSEHRQESMAASRVEEDLAQYIQFASRQRPDVLIEPYAKPIGPLLRYRPDLLVVSDQGMELAIEIKGGIFKVEFLAGIALNWHMATKGKVPLFIVLLVRENQIPEYDPGNLENWTFLHPLEMLKRDGYIAGYAVTGNNLPEQIPDEIRLEALKARIGQILRK
jgi:transcriptional regulator with XRE-family HTH domain